MPTIDPSNAAVDFDNMTLTGYSIMPNGPVESTQGPVLSVLLTVNLTGGLGRMAFNGEQLLTNDIRTVAVSGVFLKNDPTVEDQMRLLLDKWQSWNTPLRFLDFGDKAMLLEDQETFIVLPPGERHVELANLPARDPDA